MSAPAPDLALERALLASGVRVLACADEVGRGALAGPVAIGMVALLPGVADAPAGVKDSKLLSPAARERLVPAIRAWTPAAVVGLAGAAEVDEHGIVPAMRLAGERALRQLAEAGLAPDAVLLDGNLDYLSAPGGPEVRTRVKADLTCAGVAAASVVAKVHRDGLMAALDPDFPEYGWAGNKGYASPGHLDALRRLGVTPHHRTSWRLPSPL